MFSFIYIILSLIYLVKAFYPEETREAKEASAKDVWALLKTVEANNNELLTRYTDVTAYWEGNRYAFSSERKTSQCTNYTPTNPLFHYFDLGGVVVTDLFNPFVEKYFKNPTQSERLKAFSPRPILLDPIYFERQGHKIVAKYKDHPSIDLLDAKRILDALVKSNGEVNERPWLVSLDKYSIPKGTKGGIRYVRFVTETVGGSVARNLVPCLIAKHKQANEDYLLPDKPPQKQFGMKAVTVNCLPCVGSAAFSAVLRSAVELVRANGGSVTLSVQPKSLAEKPLPPQLEELNDKKILDLKKMVIKGEIKVKPVNFYSGLNDKDLEATLLFASMKQEAKGKIVGKFYFCNKWKAIEGVAPNIPKFYNSIPKREYRMEEKILHPVYADFTVEGSLPESFKNSNYVYLYKAGLKVKDSKDEKQYLIPFGKNEETMKETELWIPKISAWADDL